MILTSSQIQSKIRIVLLVIFLISIFRLTPGIPNQMSPNNKVFQPSQKPSLKFMSAFQSKRPAQKFLQTKNQLKINTSDVYFHFKKLIEVCDSLLGAHKICLKGIHFKIEKLNPDSD